MSVRSLLSSLTSTSARRRPPASRLCLEPLEHRCLLSFGPAANYYVGLPRGVEVGDFNGDGRTDVVSAADMGVAVLLNNGAGSLADEVIYPLGQLPLSAVVGDLNSDGKLDLVATTVTDRLVGYGTDYYGDPYPMFVSEGHVKVLLGDGTGSFTATDATYDLGDGRQFGAVLGDLDRDGDLDLHVPNLDSTNASVLLGNGDGTFSAPRAVAVGTSSYDVDLADLNEDGNLDLIAGSAFGNVVRVLLGNGNGTFRPAQTVATFTANGTPASVGAHAVADVNHDGTLDLAVTYNVGYEVYDGEYQTVYFEGHVQVLLGAGDGTFAPGDNYRIGIGYIQPVEIADFDDDGNLDIVVGGNFDGYVGLLRGGGDGRFGTPELSRVGSVRGVPDDIVVADLDANGAPDIATANFSWSTISVLLSGVSPPSAMSLGDVTVTEGNTGTRAATFTVTLSAASSHPVTVVFSTANGSAAAGSDYQATSGTLTIAAGQTTGTITVLVNGDRAGEPNETFVVNLSSPINATITDGQGEGTIVDDEPRISISDVSKAEGKRGKTTQFTFTITLSAPYDQPVTMSYSTADGTAKSSDGDYIAKTGTITFAAGQTTKTITIEVKGDSKEESHETFYLDLSGLSSNGLFTKSRGVGTILNDD